MVEHFNFFFRSYTKCLISEIFPTVKSYSILPVAKTFNQRMRKFRTRLRLHAPWLLYVCFASWKKPGFCLI